jgi:hypothetical protein
MVTAGGNQLTSLNITNCGEISDLRIYSNQLTNLDFLTNLNPSKITTLTIANNKFPSQDLTILSCFINCKKL